LDEVRKDKNFLSGFITGDETWLYCYDTETNQHTPEGVICRVSLKFRNNCCPTCDSKMSVKAVFPAVAERLDPLHELRGALRWPETKVSIYFVIDSVRKLYDTPSYHTSHTCGSSSSLRNSQLFSSRYVLTLQNRKTNHYQCHCPPPSLSRTNARAHKNARACHQTMSWAT
jgi:hypothetical protein